MADPFDLPMPPAIEFDIQPLSGLKFYSHENVEFMRKATKTTLNFMSEQVSKRDARIAELEANLRELSVFGVEPDDSLRLLKLREVIDDVGAWRSDEVRDEGDYEDCVRYMASRIAELEARVHRLENPTCWHCEVLLIEENLVPPHRCTSCPEEGCCDDVECKQPGCADDVKAFREQEVSSG